MKKIIILATLILMTGCASQPQDIPMSGKASTDVKLDTNVLGITFDSFLKVLITNGDTFNVSNDNGAFNVPTKK